MFLCGFYSKLDHSRHIESLFKIMFIRKNLSIISFHINDVHIIHQQITINKKESEKK